MSIPRRVGRDYLSGDDGQAALRSLTAIERIACERLIVRQFAYRPKMQVVLARYGPEGTVRLCAARAILAYLWLDAVITVAFSIAGITIVAGTGGVLMFLLCLTGTCRAISAGRSGSRWRNAQPETLTVEGD